MSLKNLIYHLSKIKDQTYCIAMAHLPADIQDIVTPFLLYHAQHHYDTTGHSFHVFDLEAEMMSSGDLGDEDDVHGIDILNTYHYWFVSFDQFDARFYSILENKIRAFNKTYQKRNIKLHLSHITGGHRRIICHSDSDNYGTYYFLIKVTQCDDKYFTYILPSKPFEHLSKEEANLEKLTDVPETKDTKQKYACIFGSELDIDLELDGSYTTINEIGERQKVILSDDYYTTWSEQYKYRHSVATIGHKKKELRKLLDSDKKDKSSIDWKNAAITTCDEIIEKYQNKYTPWVVYEDKSDHLSDLAQLLIITDIDSPNFQLYLAQFINQKKAIKSGEREQCSRVSQ